MACNDPVTSFDICLTQRRVDNDGRQASLLMLMDSFLTSTTAYLHEAVRSKYTALWLIDVGALVPEGSAKYNRRLSLANDAR